MRKIFMTAIMIMLGVCFTVAAQAQTVMTLADFIEEARVFVGDDHILTPQEAYAMIMSDPNLMVIDVNEKFEYDKGHIKGAVLLPRGLLEFKITKNDIYPEINNGRIPEKDTPILLTCMVGGRTLLSAQVLKKMGYTKVYGVKGGMNAWKAERLPLEITPGN